VVQYYPAAMPEIRLTNETGKMLGVWVEPWGLDYWMKPEDQFTVSTEIQSGTPADEAPFEVVLHDQGISVFVNVGFTADVHDQSGDQVECGHQRPIEVLRAWTESAEATAAADRLGSSKASKEHLRSCCAHASGSQSARGAVARRRVGPTGPTCETVG
jgi:hypothetical protein